MYEWIWSSLVAMISPHIHILQEHMIGEHMIGEHSLDLSNEDVPPTKEKFAESLLGRAMKCLWKHYNGTKVIVLVDEFDAPLNNALRNGYYEAASEFFAQMFSLAFKGNSAMEKACLAGIVEPVCAGVLSKLNNVGVFSVAHDRFSSYFGFTHDENSDFLNQNTTLIAQVFSWYNGYEAAPRTAGPTGPGDRPLPQGRNRTGNQTNPRSQPSQVGCVTN